MNLSSWYSQPKYSYVIVDVKISTCLRGENLTLSRRERKIHNHRLYVLRFGRRESRCIWHDEKSTYLENILVWHEKGHVNFMNICGICVSPYPRPNNRKKVGRTPGPDFSYLLTSSGSFSNLYFLIFPR